MEEDNQDQFSFLISKSTRLDDSEPSQDNNLFSSQTYKEVAPGVFVSDWIRKTDESWIIDEKRMPEEMGRGRKVKSENKFTLCRYIPFSRLYTEIENKTLTLISPSAWNDPFESLFYDPHKLTSDGFYLLVALCFTYNTFLSEESAWTVYGKDEPVVKIRVDFNKFISELSKIAQKEEVGFYFSICDYSKERKDIESKCKTFRKMVHPTLEEYLNAMSIKRKAFDYEYEIRLFVASHKPKSCFQNSNETIVPFDFEYKKVVSTVFLPPLQPFKDDRKNDYKKLQEIQNEGMREYLKCVFPSKMIYQSQLYWIDMLSKNKKQNKNTMTASREDILKKKFNNYWNCVLRTSGVDYYSKMCLQQFVGLKTALNDINNIITLKVTQKFIELLLNNGVIDSQKCQKILNDINNTSPNANGYDLEYSDGKTSLVAEVKCNVPVNGNQFGSAQQNSIMNDIDYLTKGKNKAKTSPSLLPNYLKFLVLLDVGDKIHDAMAKLPAKYQQCLKEFSGGTLDPKYVYVVYIPL